MNVPHTALSLAVAAGASALGERNQSQRRKRAVANKRDISGGDARAAKAAAILRVARHRFVDDAAQFQRLAPPRPAPSACRFRRARSAHRRYFARLRIPSRA